MTTEISVHNRCFIPISVGHPYFSAKNVSQLLELLISNEVPSTIVVCDSLRIITNIIKDVHADPVQACEKATTDTVRMITKIIQDNSHIIKVVRSSEYGCRDDYHHLRSRVFDLLICKESLDFICNLALKNLDKLRQDHSVNNISHELMYLVEETAISIYTTEILNYRVETYFRSEHGFVDFLYRDKPSAIKKLLATESLKRRFCSWDDLPAYL